MTTKYIEIDRAIETALLLLEEGEDEQTLAYNAALVAFIKNMENVPAADVVEVVRCKDCKHRPIATRADEGILWGFSVEFPDERCPLQCEDGWYNHYPKDDFYCANAERRTDE